MKTLPVTHLTCCNVDAARLLSACSPQLQGRDSIRLRGRGGPSQRTTTLLVRSRRFSQFTATDVPRSATRSTRNLDEPPSFAIKANLATHYAVAMLRMIPKADLMRTCHRTRHPLHQVAEVVLSSSPESFDRAGRLGSTSATAVCTPGRTNDLCDRAIARPVGASLQRCVSESQ